MFMVTAMVYLFFAPCAALDQSEYKYQWVDSVTGEALECDRCPPGTYVVKHCTRDTRTVCGTCPHMHFTEYWNYVEKCLYCSVSCTEEQYEKVKCSPKHNSVCECKSGFYFNNGFCSRHRVCPAGEGVILNGTAEANVQCEPCPDGYYSSTVSSTDTCQRHSQCSAEERAIPGHAKHDTFCTTCTSYSKSGDPVCDQAVIDYLSQQYLPAKKLQRLKNTISRYQQNPDYETLSDILVYIKTRPQQRFIYKVLFFLKKARLFALEDKVRALFLHESYDLF